MISIGNGISSGGGFYLNPNAIINDGLLDLSIFDEVTRLRLLTALPMALVNKVEKIREAKLFRSDAFKIIMRTPALIHCDGEIISTQLKTAEIKVRKNEMFIRKTKNKRFDYQPRYYKPEKDEELKRKRKLGFRSNYRQKTSTKKPYAYIIMLAIILYIFLKYNGYI